jgi:predicted TPR repeat methyltransferase
VLDAGCGTGLCGPLLKPYVKRLIGVDLSSGMLNKARGRALYDDLVEADLVTYLNGCHACFDLIVSADTLVYFGDLQPFLQSAQKALKRAGNLVFTLEKCEEAADNGYKLNFHGRYSHTHDYVKEALDFSGFAMQSAESVVLRKESGQPVIGMLVVAGLT